VAVSGLQKKAVRNRLKEDGSPKKSIAFFHPPCNAGGGGEKVLWCMIDALFKQDPRNNLEIVIYSGEIVPDIEILKKAEDRFNVKFGNRAPKFIQLTRTQWIKPMRAFTILGQILGTMYLAFEAMYKYQPDIFIDSVGLAFSFRIVKKLLPKCKVVAYVHYPFISMDMLDAVGKRGESFNNSSRIADSPILSRIKYFYYQRLIYEYGQMSKFCDYVWANSTWTRDQMERVWPSFKGNISRLYPPCSTTNFSKLKMDRKENIMMSFAQFRPEKHHKLQLDIFKKVLVKRPDTDLRFYIVGSVRGAEDEDLLKDLKKYADQIDVANRVTFFKNLSYDELLKKFEVCSIGIHTMNAEHFGIAIVEMMAAGLLTIAHNSAGPKYDIIKEREEPVGFLAQSADDYVNAVCVGIDTEKQGYVKAIVERARNDVNKFSDEEFKKNFVDQLFNYLSFPL
jgi:alpha-1,2-mannosyltransferase